MTRLVLTLLLLSFVSAQAQTYLPRSELTKPLSEAVEKPLAEFVERWEACLSCNCVTKSHAFIATENLSASCTPFPLIQIHERLAI